MEYKDNELPVGFGMALLSRPDAVLAFSSMTDRAREEWIRKAKNVEDSRAMEKLISDLAVTSKQENITETK